MMIEISQGRRVTDAWGELLAGHRKNSQECHYSRDRRYDTYDSCSGAVEDPQRNAIHKNPH